MGGAFYDAMSTFIVVLCTTLGQAALASDDLANADLDFAARSSTCRQALAPSDIGSDGSSTGLRALQSVVLGDRCLLTSVDSGLSTGSAAETLIRRELMDGIKDKFFEQNTARAFFDARLRAAKTMGALPSKFQEKIDATSAFCKSSSASTAAPNGVDKILSSARDLASHFSPALSPDAKAEFERKHFLAMMEVARLSRALQAAGQDKSSPSGVPASVMRARLKSLLAHYPDATQFVNPSQSIFENDVRPDKATASDVVNSTLIWNYLMDAGPADHASDKAFAEAFEAPSLAFVRYKTILSNRDFPQVYKQELKGILRSGVDKSLYAIQALCAANPCDTFALAPKQLSQAVRASDAESQATIARAICACHLDAKTTLIAPKIPAAFEYAAGAGGVVCAAGSATGIGAALAVPSACVASAAAAGGAAVMEMADGLAASPDRYASNWFARVAQALPGEDSATRLRLVDSDLENSSIVSVHLTRGLMDGAGAFGGSEAIEAAASARLAEEALPIPLQSAAGVSKQSARISSIDIPIPEAEPIPFNGRRPSLGEVRSAGIVAVSKDQVQAFIDSPAFHDGIYTVMVAKNPLGGPPVVVFSPRSFPGVAGMEGKIVTHRSLINRFYDIFGKYPEALDAGESLINPAGKQMTSSNAAGSFTNGNSRPDNIEKAMNAIGFDRVGKPGNKMVLPGEQDTEFAHTKAREVAQIEKSLGRDAPRLIPEVRQSLTYLAKRYADATKPNEFNDYFFRGFIRLKNKPDPSWSAEKLRAYEDISGFIEQRNDGSTGAVIMNLKNKAKMLEITTEEDYQEAIWRIDHSGYGRDRLAELRAIPRYLGEYEADVEAAAKEAYADRAAKIAERTKAALQKLPPALPPMPAEAAPAP